MYRTMSAQFLAASALKVSYSTWLEPSSLSEMARITTKGVLRDSTALHLAAHAAVVRCDLILLLPRGDKLISAADPALVYVNTGSRFLHGFDRFLSHIFVCRKSDPLRIRDLTFFKADSLHSEIVLDCIS